MDIKDRIIGELLDYMEWDDKYDYSGWNNIKIYINNTLIEAWIDARPNDTCTFDDKKFKNMVDGANGKWLEKQNPDDSYKVILSTEYGRKSIDKLARILVHELRHCLDYQNAVSALEFDDYCPGSQYYENWSEFRAVVCDTRFSFFSAMKGDFSNHRECFNKLAEILGRMSADCVEGLLSSDSVSETMYYLSRYIGVSRAVRNLNVELGLKSKSLHLWSMTPAIIIEKYGNVFYLASEWDERESCSLDEKSGENYNVIINLIQNQ